jgi:Cytochrome c7 and related cytochrome c
MTLRRTLGWIAALLAAAFLTLAPALESAAAGAPPITVPFDHLSTGFELDGVHRDLPCESCHLNAIFKGTPRNCGICHITGSTFNATPKTATHIMSTNNCAACHDTTSFRPDIHFDHGEVMGSCVSCHNGTIAEGEGPTHPATSQQCDACHTVMSWNPPKTVDHTQIPLAVSGFCIICHNGVQATGKNPGHVVTSLECGDCHLTTTWLGANFNHTGIKSGCVSCHNGVKAVGKQGNHMPTTNLCENCHTTGIGTATPSWVPSAFDHTQMTVTTCQTCHSGTVKISTGFVSGQPSNHVPPIPSTIDCGVCHGNTPTAETWTVLAASIPVLHTGLNVANCTLCHGGETFAGIPAPYIPMSISGVSPTKKTPLAPPHIPILAGTDCSACHGAAYQAGGFGPATAMSAAKHKFVSTTCDACHDTGKSFYVGTGTPLQLRPADHINSGDPSMVSGDCSKCHTTTDWTSNAMPAGHMPNPSNLSCLTCHTKSPSDYTPATLAANSVLHQGISGNCGLCHGNNVAALTWANNFTPKDALLSPIHIPYLSGTDCSSCHSSSTYAVGTFGPMNMTQAKHSFVPTSCNTCHEAGLSFYIGAASPALQGRPADHTIGQMVAPNDCSLCHTTANWNSNALPTGHMPNPGNAACTVCHTTAPADYTPATLAAIPVLHTGVNGGCGTCHGGTTVLTWYNNYVPKDALLTPSHIPYLSGTDCSSCHAANYVSGGFGPTNMTAAKHAFVPTTCDTCHEAGLSFYLGASTPALQGRPADHMAPIGTAQQQTGDCSGCHTTANWVTTALPAGHMPNPGGQSCAICHTGDLSTQAGYATLAAISVLHTGISGNCGQCHGSPAGALTFYNNNDPIKAAVLGPPVHIPYLTGADCSSCHAANYVAGGFGPTNMSAAKHAFVPTTCDTCHEAGLSFYLGASSPALQGRPANHVSTPNPPSQATGDCNLCHNTTVWTTPTTLPNGHMPIPGTQTCSVCHVGNLSTIAGYATMASIPILHTGITTGCDQCHGGTTPLTFYNNNDNPKAAPATHIPSFANNDCSACHTNNYVAGGFGPMNMTQATHAAVSASACKTCHEAGLSFYMGAANPGLQGRPADHTAGQQVAPNDCSLCHTTANWITTVLPAGHMPNPANQTCNVCHTSAPTNYKVFAANSVLHTGISGGCAQCHGAGTQLSFYNNDMVVKDNVLAPPHIPYLAGTDCSVCHKSTTYAVGTFGPMNMTQATHAVVSTTCATCHGTATVSFYMGAANPTLQLRPSDHTSGTMLTGDCGGCHTTANWNSNSLPAGHMPNPGNQACTVCHTGAPSNYKVFAANSVLHTGIAGNCSQCHGAGTQLSFYNNDMVIKDNVLSPAHIPYLAGTDCSSCHKSTTYAVGTFGPMNMAQATHAFVSTTCDTCHASAAGSLYMGAANPALQLRPADHNSGTMLTGDCSGCHTTANWNSGSLPAGHMPNPGNQGCVICHTAYPTNYTTMAANAVLHTGITSGCITCHGQTQLSFYNNNDPPKPMVANHIPSGATPCEDCHSATTFTSFTGTTMSSAKHTLMFAVIGKTCDACHETGKSFYGVTNLTTRPNNHHVGQDCSGCHSPNDWGGGAAKKTVAAATASRSTIGTVVSASAPAQSASRVTAPLFGAQTRLVATGVGPFGNPIMGIATSGGTAIPGAAVPSHAGVVSNCVSCHNGVLAQGKEATHIASNNACQNCHTTVAWLPARFDHQGVTASCVSCHNGVSASGKPVRHVQTTQDCGACHGTITWAAATFNHLGINATCQSCHNGVTATGKQAQHPSTTQDCGVCHNTLNWATTKPPAPLRPLLARPRAATVGPAK